MAAPAKSPTLNLPGSLEHLLERAQRRELPCGDGQLVWHLWGVESALTPVLLLHGGSGSWTHWVRNIDALMRSGRQVLVPDLPGFGDSALAPDGHDADALAAPLEAALRSLIGERRCAVAGFSFGGMVAGFWAADWPQRFERLILVGAPALGIVGRRVIDVRGWRHLPSTTLQDAVHRHNLGVLMLHDVALIDQPTLDLHRANAQRDRMARRRLAHTDVLARALERFAGPVYAIYGALDALYLNQTQLLEPSLRACAPGFRQLWLIEHAGHWVQYEASDAFDVALAEALQD